MWSALLSRVLLEPLDGMEIDVSDAQMLVRRRLNGRQWLGVMLVVSGLAVTGLDASHFGPDATRATANRPAKTYSGADLELIYWATIAT